MFSRRHKCFTRFTGDCVFYKTWRILCDVANFCRIKFFCEKSQIFFSKKSLFIKSLQIFSKIWQMFARNRKYFVSDRAFTWDGEYCATLQLFYERSQLFCERFHILRGTANVVWPCKCFTRLKIFCKISQFFF